MYVQQLLFDSYEIHEGLIITGHLNSIEILFLAVHLFTFTVYILIFSYRIFVSYRDYAIHVFADFELKMSEKSWYLEKLMYNIEI